MNPVTICRSENERVMIEPSVNAVRVSVLIKQMDDMDTILCKKFTRFLMQRAEQFIVMRRKPVDGFSISFLVTRTHLENYWKHKLIDFVIQFMEEIDSEVRRLGGSQLGWPTARMAGSEQPRRRAETAEGRRRPPRRSCAPTGGLRAATVDA